ncbi:MAG: prephenate dehydratase [Cellvibrionales bacterium]|nr:prephenate dehydratase [Cellvibrionales bacterium]
MTDKTLDSLRLDIDRIDRTIHELLNERAVCAQHVADVKLAEKKATGSDAPVLFYRPEREAQVLAKVKERNQGPLPDNAVAHIFREIMSACLALEEPVKVAYLGPKGTFTHSAAIKHFGYAVDAIPTESIEEVFAGVETGEMNYGIVPVENSSQGIVALTLDNFMQSSVTICGEVELPVKHMLLANANVDQAKISKICAHQQALAQCKQYLDKHWPDVIREPVSSNARACQMAAEDSAILAIASSNAADLYDLSILDENIQDYRTNTTRFLILGQEEVGPSGSDKTSIIVSVKNKPGALFVLLEAFEREQVMLTRIDTRPSRTEKWAYVFFIEFEGHQQDAVIQKILQDLSTKSIAIKMLGSYPKAVL